MIERIAADELRDRLDEDGRPLGEQASPLSTASEVVCPYSGARRGRPMNAEALAQMTPIWGQVVADIVGLQPDATVLGAWRGCMAAVLRPLSYSGPVPRLHAASYKAALGFSQVLTFLALEEGVAALPLRELGTGAEMAAQIEAGGWLLGQEQVCAGSPAMIEQLATALAEARGGAAPDPRVDAAVALVGELLDELEHRRTGSPRPGRASDVLASGRPSWTRAITMSPGRRASDVRRLQQPSGGA